MGTECAGPSCTGSQAVALEASGLSGWTPSERGGPSFLRPRALDPPLPPPPAPGAQEGAVAVSSVAAHRMQFWPQSLPLLALP